MEALSSGFGADPVFEVLCGLFSEVVLCGVFEGGEFGEDERGCFWCVENLFEFCCVLFVLGEFFLGWPERGVADEGCGFSDEICWDENSFEDDLVYVDGAACVLF